METIKEIYFKEMSGDVFLCSAFAKAITPSRAVLGDFMFSGAVPLLRDEFWWGGMRKGLFPQNPF